MTRERKTGPASPRSIETCKLDDVEPQAYITGVLDRLVNIVGLPRASTSSCRGHGRRRPHPIASPPDPQRQLTKAVRPKRRLPLIGRHVRLSGLAAAEAVFVSVIYVYIHS